MDEKKTIGVSYIKAVEFKNKNIELIGTEIIYKNFKEKIIDLIIIPLSLEGNIVPYMLFQAAKKKDIALSCNALFHLLNHALFAEMDIAALDVLAILTIC